MLVAFLIMLREGIEASLIVGIIASYLAQTGRRQYLGAVWAGVGIAAAICAAIGVALTYASAEFPQRQQEMFESAVALVAVVILTSMVFWMKSAAKSIKGALHDKVDASIATSHNAALALVAMAFFAVGREGLESVFFLLAIFQQSTGYSVPLGALLGLLGAVAVGLLIYWGGVKLDLRRFFRVTGVFIIVVAAGLLAGFVRTMHEAGLWNGLQQVVADWSQVLPADGPLGTVLAGMFGYNDNPTLGEVAIYFAYLIPALILFFLPARQSVPVPHHA
ncbi:Ferrous iron permease EfeU [Beijerinckiaceae bacterium RH AL1]|jgi:high-affinity iron transporter|nr:FTR1 family iron permease [Beijerinckiaceae bacterium]VVB48683.1 Ferrous iron permease EfeU [Beijerinckiaceae bacterium RH CH11]VVB48765.1 Ferrous iron permease EfeU [Beijerinckiaceae bacterium RH AL8]VVC56516.1 Ferrous iron permease EfeU [Beijerinckiaceae bacterium RH AL1]